MMIQFIRKVYVLISFMAFISLCIPEGVLAGDMPDVIEEGNLGDERWSENWSVIGNDSRVYYRTHGTVVWGHEFGFYKSPEDPEQDILWLTFSSMDEKVKEFEGKDVLVLFEIDGVPYKIELTMLSTSVIGTTHVMLFTNWTAGPKLIEALVEGRYVEVQILEPADLEVLMDIKKDKFGLEGFAASRENAKEMCERYSV